MRRPIARLTSALSLLCAGAVALVAQQAPPPLVTEQEIRAGLPADGTRWLTFGGGLDNQRHSPLTEITPGNVDQLVPQWTFQTGTVGEFETTPLLRDNVLYVTGPNNLAWAIDARSGRQILALPPRAAVRPDGMLRARQPRVRHARRQALPGHARRAPDRPRHEDRRRRLGRHDGGFLERLRGHHRADHREEQGDHGVAGGEFGIRGFIDAYDAATGKRAWRFYTVPGPGEPGNDTWAGDSWKAGGAGVWVTGAYDPELNLLYYGIGNPGPDYHSESRKGDNLYSNSLVALDADTGALRWHYQFTPHDLHDWDATEVPVLADLDDRRAAAQGGDVRQSQRLLLHPGPDERKDHHGQTVRDDDLGEGDRPDGRPVLLPGHVPDEKGALTCPDLVGGTNFWQPSFDPAHADLLRQCARGLHDLLRVEARVQGGRALHRRRRSAGPPRRQSGIRRPASAQSRHGRAEVGVSLHGPVDLGAADDGVRPRCSAATPTETCWRSTRDQASSSGATRWARTCTAPRRLPTWWTAGSTCSCRPGPR